MTEKLAIVQNAASALFGKDKGTPTTDSPRAAESGAATGSSKGDKGLRRLPVSNQTATDATPAAPADTTQTVQPYQTLSQLMSSLLSQAAANLAASQNNMANILNLTAQQGQAASDAAITNQVDLNQQLEEQQRRSKRMKILGWAVKGVVIAVAMTSVVASGGLTAAPVATLLMLSLTTLTVVKPDLLNNKVIGPLTNELVKAGMPEAWANVLATVIVITVLVAATAGAGAAEGSLIGKDGVNYTKMALGNAGVVNGLLMGSTDPFGKIVEAFPNAPMWAQILGTTTSLLIATMTGLAGGMALASSGAMSAEAEALGLRTAAKLGVAGMDFVGGGARVALGQQTIAQGETQKDIMDIRSNVMLDQTAIQNANTFSLSVKDLMDVITQSLKSLAEATRSLTAPAAAAISSSR